MQINDKKRQIEVQQKAAQLPGQQREVQEGTQGKIRRSGLEDYIDNLTDKRSFFSRVKDWLRAAQQPEDFLQDFKGEELAGNFKHIKERFEKYKKVGIEIPKDISENFDPEGDKAVFITEEQANRLKKLGLEGEQKYQKALVEKNLPYYGDRKPHYGDFEVKDVATNVFGTSKGMEELSKEDRLNLLSTSTGMRGLMNERMRVVLNPTDLKVYNEKLQFARDHNLKINIQFLVTDEEAAADKDADFNAFVAFAEKYPDLVANVEIIRLDCFITKERETELQKVFDGCISLNEFTCFSIMDGVTLKFSSNLTHLYASDIQNNVTLLFSSHLSFFEYWSLGDNFSIQYPESISDELISVDIGTRRLPFPKLFNSFGCGDILPNDKVVLPEGLIKFRCSNIGNNATITCSNSLASFHSSSISGNIILSENLNTFMADNILDNVILDLQLCVNLKTCYVGDIGENVTVDLSGCEGLRVFKCRNVAATANIIFPKVPPQLVYCRFGEIHNPVVREELEELKSRIPQVEEMP